MDYEQFLKKKEIEKENKTVLSPIETANRKPLAQEEELYKKRKRKMESEQDQWKKGTLSEPSGNFFPMQTHSNENYQNLDKLRQNMEYCLEIIDDEVMKGYLTKLDQLPVIEPDVAQISELKNIHFFKITELVYQENEFSVHKLSILFHALSNKPCTLVFMIHCNGKKNDFYFGVRSRDEYHSSSTMMQMLKQSIAGLFPGSQIEDYYDEDMTRDMQQLDVGCISSVTCVADYKQETEIVTNQDFVQGLEKLIDSMKGKAYTSVLIADNVTYSDLSKIRQEYEQIYTQLSPFANMQFNFAQNTGSSTSDSQTRSDSKTSSYGITQGRSQTLSHSEGRTTGSSLSAGGSDSRGRNLSLSQGGSDTVGYSYGENQSISYSHTEGKYKGTVINAGISGIGAGKSQGSSSSDTYGETRGTSITDSVSRSISQTLSHGISDTHTDTYQISDNQSVTDNDTYGYGRQQGSSYQTGTSFQLANSQTLTNTFGDSQGITLNSQNMTLISTLDKLQKHLDRIQECESLGMWNFAAYFLGESAAETETAANMYRSVVSGMQSGIERSAVNTWFQPYSLDAVTTYVKNFIHPRFQYNRFSYDTIQSIPVNPSALVSTNELAIHMGLPRHSVNGLPVIQHAVFAQEVLTRNREIHKPFHVGNIYHLGVQTDTDIKLDGDSLTMHTFITGSTGAGKSNAVYHLLREAEKQQIPFLVVEPAKGEYRNVFPHVRCFGTNPNLGELLQLNPFAFPKGIHVLEHIDRLIEIFNVCWPMYAAMPAVLKESVENAYRSAGWDFDLSVNLKMDGLYPTFDDVLRELRDTIKNSDYSAETKGDYIGSLSTRIKSLTNGIYGRIFVSEELDSHTLFDESAILDISRVGSMETKSLIMGLIVLKLQEYRMAHADKMNCELKHITVLEEAHNLLKKTSIDQSSDHANLLGKSVEMLTNAIAEIRTFGEAFIIVDQAPDLLDTAAIRNTNTKIVFRLPEGNDRKVTGTSIALNDSQITELSKLPTGVSALYQNDWQEAVLCKWCKQEVPSLDSPQILTRKPLLTRKQQNDEILHMLLKHPLSREESTDLKEKIKKLNLSAKIRSDLTRYLDERGILFEQAVGNFIQKNYHIENAYQSTQTSTLEFPKQLAEVMLSNLEPEFQGFESLELLQILCCICLVVPKNIPDHPFRHLRKEYLKKELSQR